MTLAKKFARIDQFSCFFYANVETVDEMDGCVFDLNELQNNANNERLADAFSHGLFKPFNNENGGVLEHAGLTMMYPLLHLCKVVTDTLTLNIPGAIIHAISFPLSLAYFLVGLITRTIASIANICCGSTSEDFETDRAVSPAF